MKSKARILAFLFSLFAVLVELGLMLWLSITDCCDNLPQWVKTIPLVAIGTLAVASIVVWIWVGRRPQPRTFDWLFVLSGACLALPVITFICFGLAWLWTR